MSAARSSRWLLLGSLALNLFFIGIAIAMAVRTPSPPPTERNEFARAERIAATLPLTDGNLLRETINSNRQALDSAQVTYRAPRVWSTVLRDGRGGYDGRHARGERGRVGAGPARRNGRENGGFQGDSARRDGPDVTP